MLFPLYIAFAIGNALVSIVSFFLYVRTRLSDRTEARHPDASRHVCHLAALDRKERRYQRIHFITLSLFVLFGVLILVELSSRSHHRITV